MILFVRWMLSELSCQVGYDSFWPLLSKPFYHNEKSSAVRCRKEGREITISILTNLKPNGHTWEPGAPCRSINTFNPTERAQLIALLSR